MLIPGVGSGTLNATAPLTRSEEHTSELQSRSDLVCRLLLEKKKKNRVARKISPLIASGTPPNGHLEQQADLPEDIRLASSSNTNNPTHQHPTDGRSCRAHTSIGSMIDLTCSGIAVCGSGIVQIGLSMHQLIDDTLSRTI